MTSDPYTHQCFLLLNDLFKISLFFIPERIRNEYPLSSNRLNEEIQASNLFYNTLVRYNILYVRRLNEYPTRL